MSLRRSLLNFTLLGALSVTWFPDASRAAAALTLPAGHPRLWFGDAARLQQARDYFASHPFALPAYNAFDPAGTNYTRALRSVLTGDPQACLHALNGNPNSPPPPRPELPTDTGLMGLAFVDPGTAPATFRDQMRQQGESWLLVYDWCHVQLTQTQIAALVQRWNGYLQRELDDDFAQQGEEASNYWSGRVRNLLLWGMASHGENPRAQEFIDAALETRMGEWFPAWYAGFGRGGVFPEGSDYGVVSLSYPLIAFTSAADFGHDEYARTPYFREAIYALIYGSTPGPTSVTDAEANQFLLFPFGDDQLFRDGSAINERSYLGDFMQAMGVRAAPAGNARHARAWRAASQAGTDWLFRALQGAAGDPSDLAQLPLDYYAPGAGVFAARTAHDAGATQVHLQLGTPGGMSHRHMDAGNFQFWRKGRWITRESAGYSDRLVALGEASGSRMTIDTEDAVAHNTLLFEGQSTGQWIGDGPQPIPPSGNPESDQPRNLPQVRRLQHAEDFAYVAVDYSDAYRNGLDTRVDWPYAESAWREFLFIRPLQALLIFDRTRGSSDSLRPFYGSDDWLLRDLGRRIGADAVQRHFIMHFETLPTVLGNRITATVGNQVAELTTLLPAAPNVRVVNEDFTGPPDDSPAGQFRVEIAQSGTADAYFLNLVTGYDPSEAAIQTQLSEVGGVLTIHLQHPTRGDATVTLNKGMMSSGGSIRIGNGPMQALRASVQGIAVTDDGPVWESDCIFCDGFE